MGCMLESDGGALGESSGRRGSVHACYAWGSWVAACLVTVGLLFAAAPVFGAARITSIQPACAAPGQRVTLIGGGFGARNVRVTVVGVPASVVSATGNRVTFVVPLSVQPGPTTVTAKNPGVASDTASVPFNVKGPERCNGVDDDCDGTVDDGFDVGASCSVGTGACLRTGTTVCRADGSGTVCDAMSGDPVAEVCNGVDDDCDGIIDDGFDVGIPCSTGVGACLGSGVTVCAPDGGLGCNATPGQPVPEACNGLDDDCDGTVDNGFSLGVACSVGVGACARDGWTVCAGDGTGTACDAVAGEPAAEACNGVDDDCDGQVDEGLTQPFYRDADGDGFGNPADSVQACAAPLGYLTDSGDCDDAGVGIHPGAVEVAGNGIDEDCDGSDLVTNLPPSFTSEPVTEATAEFTYVYQASASDPEGGAVTFALRVAPAGMSVDATTGRIVWTPGAGVVGDHDVVVEAGDAVGAASTQTYVLKVGALNLSPIITSVPPRAVHAGETYHYDVEAFDPEGDAVTYDFAADPPAGMTIDAQTGEVAWTAGSAGEVAVSVRARDSGTGTDVQTYVVEVFDDPLALFAPAGAFEAFVGETLTLPLQANYADAGFSVDPLPANASLEGATFSFTPAADQLGVHTLSVQAHYAGMDAANVVVVLVSRHNRAPTIAPLGIKTVDEGQTLTIAVEATDADGDSLQYAAPGLSVQNAYFNEITHQLAFTPSFEQAGTYSVTFAVSDGEATATATATIEVKEVQPPAEAIDLVVDPLGTPTFQTTQTVTGSVTGQIGPPPAPRSPVLITGLSPTSVRQGRAAVVGITGFNTQFAAGSSTANFGDGIVVESFDVLSPTSARAAIRADRLAAAGLRQVRVAQGGTDTYSVVAFMVEPGAAVIAGTVVDPFTQQPLANARVGINGTTLSVQTDAQGRFTLDGVPPGPATLLVTLPNYEVKKIDLAVGANDMITIGEPVGVNALARPASPGGTLPRAATVASVLDRGVTNKGGGLTLEQAKMVIVDTLVAVGGTEVGVLDEAGKQLNPKIEGAGDLSLTPLGVERHAKALMQGDVYTLKEFAWLLQMGFKFRTPTMTVQKVLTGLQDVVDQAWANPSDPRWSMAIVLFNEGTTLSLTAPVLTPDTPINRFQAFLLLTSFMLYNAANLDESAQRILEANGVDWRSAIQPQSAPARGPSRVAARGLTEQLRAGLRHREFLMAAPAYAQQIIPPEQVPPQTIGDLTARRSFTTLWRQMKGSLIAESTTGAAIIGVITFASQMLVGWSLGATGGLPGAAFGLVIAAQASFNGYFLLAFQKVVLTWFIGLVAASIEPAPLIVHDAHLDERGNLVITIERSPSEIATNTGTGPLPLVSPEAIGYAYHVYRFPHCLGEPDAKDGEWMGVPAELVLSDERNRQDPPLGKLQFVIPRSRLQLGTNYFRTVVVQYLHNASKDVVEGASNYDTDGDQQLSLAEFIKNDLGDDAAFAGFDLNHDSHLDDTEFKRQTVVDNPAADALGRNSDDDSLPFARPISGSAAAYKLAVEQARQDVQADVRQAEEAAAQRGETRAAQRAQAGQRQLLWRQIDRYVADSDARNEFKARYGGEAAEVDWKTNLSNSVADGVVKRPDGTTEGPESFDDPNSKVNQYFRSRFGRAPTAQETADLKAVTERIVELRQLRVREANALQGQRQLQNLRQQVETIDVPPGQSRFISAEYASEEGGVAVTKRVTVEVRAGAQQEAVTRVQALIATEQEQVSNPISRQTTTAEESLQSRVRGMHSTAFLDAEAELAARQTQRTPEQQARFREFLRSGRSIRQTQARQVQQTRSSGRPPSLGLPTYYPTFNATSGVGLSIVGQLSSVSYFLSGVQTLRSDFGGCIPFEHSGVPLPTEAFPPTIVPHPDQEEVGAVLRPLRDPIEPKGGLIERQYPLSEPTVSLAEAGFPPAFLTTDIKGRIYADNRNSNARFSGRLFRFTPMQAPGGSAAPGEPVPFTITREFVGTINYYSLSLQFGRPAFPVAMVAGPPFWGLGEGVYPIQTQDLFVADTDVMDGTRRILRVPVSLTDTSPNTFSEASGNRIRIVGQPWVQSDDFWFTGPSDMEVGPDATSPVPLDSANGVIVLSDEESIFVSFADALGTPQLRRVIQIPGRRWSGLAFDRAGKLYFADYWGGEVWLMTWDQLYDLISTETSLNDEETLQSTAFMVARGLDRPGDIEIEQGSSANPGRTLFISTFDGIDKLPLPIVGRLAGPVRDMRIKRFLKEDDVHILADGLSFFVEPSYDDLLVRDARLRVALTDPETGGGKWVERQVILAEHGATVLENWQP